MATATIDTSFQPVIDLNRYLEVSEGEICLAGTKIALWQIVQAYEDGASPEQIAFNYQGINLTQVYATITYYLANRAAFQSESDTPDTQADLVKTLREQLSDRYHVTSEENRVRLTPK